LQEATEEPDYDPTPRHTTLRFRVVDDLHLTGDSWGEVGNPPVLLLHGGGQTRHSWSGTARSLAEDGWHAVAVDLRGHGESDWAEDGDYHHLSFARDVISLAETFAEPPVLVGASLGGIASLLATSLTEEPVARALILVDIATRMEPKGAARIIEFMTSHTDGFESLEAAADAIAEYNPHRPRPTDLSGLEKNLRRRPDGRYIWHWDPSFLHGPMKRDGESSKLHDPDLLESAARALTIPTLLVRGAVSDLLSAEGARAFLEQVPHAKFADVSGAGHMVAGDRNDLFSRAVREFLSEDLDSPNEDAR